MANYDYVSMGEEMITSLGMENDLVIRYWTALEKGIYFNCNMIYTCWKNNVPI